MKIYILIALITFSTLGKAQDSSIIKSMIALEATMVNEHFGGRILLQDEVTPDNVIIKSCQSINSFKSVEMYPNYDVILVEVSFKGLNVINPRYQILDTMIFKYTFVKKNKEFYRLFGFVNSDINYIKTDMFDDKKYRSFIDWLCGTLFSNKQLTKGEVKLLKHSLLSDDKYFPEKLNSPVNIINKLFPDCLYQTILLKYNWISPIMTN